MKAEYKRQRNAKGKLYTKWILYNDEGKSIKAGSCKSQAQAEKRVDKIIKLMSSSSDDSSK